MLKKNPTVFMVLLAWILLAACGGLHSPVSSERIRGSPYATSDSASAPSPNPSAVMTEEDLRVAQMSVEERTIYLRRKLEEMLAEMGKGGTAASAKSISAITSDYHKVEVTADPRWPKRTRTDPLSPDQFEDKDWHLDRLTDGNGTIQIADITLLAKNFGQSLRNSEEDGPAGYAVYWASSQEGDWHLIGDAHPKRWDGFYPPENQPLFRSKYDCWFNEDDWDGLWLTVCPVNTAGEVGCRSEPIRFQAGAHYNSRPVADLKVTYDGDPYEEELVAEAPLSLTFDASGSSDSDGTITQYEFDVDGDGTFDFMQGAGEDTLNYEYTSPIEAIVRLRVTDDGGATAWDTFHIIATGPPEVLSFETDYDDSDAEHAECGEEVTFTVTALDPDGVFGADLTFEFEFDYVDGQGGSGFGAPIPMSDPNSNTVTCEVTHTFGRDSQPEHEVIYNSRVRVTNSVGSTTWTLSQFPDESNKLTVTHAIPHLSALVAQPSAGIAPLPVTFRVEGAYDLDEPGGEPATYYLDFGDQEHAEGEYTTEPIQHRYSLAGEYFATITLFDDDPCGPHASEPAEIRVCAFGVPDENLMTHEVVDDGAYPAHDWGNLGDPCISIAINPLTQQPGIAFTGNFKSTRQEEYVECCVLFSERYYNEAAGMFLWHAPPDWVGGESNYVQANGEQLDLEYDPFAFGEEIIDGELVQVVGRHIAATYGTKAPNALPGIYYFWSEEGAFDSLLWTRDTLVSATPTEGVFRGSPIRMVAVYDDAGVAKQFVSFFGYLSGTQGLWEAYWKLGGGVRENLIQQLDTPPRVHDHKARGDDDPLTDDRLTCGGTTSVAYLVLPTPLDVEFETRFGDDWNGAVSGVNADYGAGSHMETRSVAIDYFGPDTVGALWVGDYEVEPGVREDCVAFREGYAGSWQGPEVEVSPHVSGHIYGGWCDFDYEPLSGIGCAVYEWSAGQNNHLELRLSIGGTWTSPIPIAELGNYPSHVDTDTSTSRTALHITGNILLSGAL